MKFNKIKLIIFDVDGTLIDTDKLIIESYRELFRRFRPDYKLTEQEEISFLGPTLVSMFPKYFNEEFEVLLKVYRDYSNQNAKKFAYLYDNVKESLSYLKKQGYRLAIVTSRYKYSAEHMLDIFGILNYFDYIVGLSEVNNPKPDPEGINKCLEYFGLGANETIYIGDNQSDYYAGKNAKVVTSLVNWAKGRDNSLLNPDLLIDNYSKLMEIF